LGELAEDSLLGIGERAGRGAADVEQAVDVLAAADGGDEHSDAGVPDHLVVVVGDARVVAISLGAEGAAVGDDPDRRSLAGRQVHAVPAGRAGAGPVPEGHAPGGLVAQREGGEVGVAEGAAALDEAGEDGVEIAGAGDLAGDVDEALGLTAAMLGLLEEACVLENEGGLVGEGADEIEIGGGGGPAGGGGRGGEGNGGGRGGAAGGGGGHGGGGRVDQPPRVGGSEE